MENLGVENKAQKVISYAYTFYNAGSILSVLIVQRNERIIDTVIIDIYIPHVQEDVKRIYHK